MNINKIGFITCFILLLLIPFIILGISFICYKINYGEQYENVQNIKKVNYNNLVVGDVIVYKEGDKNVIGHIEEKYYRGNYPIYFVTDRDSPITEDIFLGEYIGN